MAQYLKFDTFTLCCQLQLNSRRHLSPSPHNTNMENRWRCSRSCSQHIFQINNHKITNLTKLIIRWHHRTRYYQLHLGPNRRPLHFTATDRVPRNAMVRPFLPCWLPRYYGLHIGPNLRPLHFTATDRASLSKSTTSSLHRHGPRSPKCNN